MDKKVIFISHVGEESKVANLLKETIEKHFIGMVNVFVSSNPDGLELGADWFSVIKSQLSKAELVLVICSPLSLNRPWINFEAGCGSIRNIPVIPLCHSGLVPGDLPFPMKAHQGAELNSNENLQNLFGRIAKAIGSRVPNSSNYDFFETLTKFETTTKNEVSIRHTQKIHGILQADIEYMKYVLVSVFADFEELPQLDALTKDFRNFNIKFNKSHYLERRSTLPHNLLVTNYNLVYKQINKIIDNVKFVLSCNRYQFTESLGEALDELLFQSSVLTTWHPSVALFVESHPEIWQSIKPKIEKTLEEPQYIPSNIINYFIDYYRSCKAIQHWITTYENIVSKTTI